MDLSIRERLESNLGKDVSDDLLFDATKMLLRILFCLDNATLLPQYFVKKGFYELARDTKDLKMSLLHNGYTLRNCKFFVNAVALKKATLWDYRKFEVHKDDAQLLIRAADESRVSTFCRSIRKDFPYVSMEKFSTALAEEISRPKMIQFMDKFLHKKLKWVMNTQGVRPYDIKTEFISHSIVRVYRTFPRIENRVHLRNLMRQVIHARGQSMIVETKKAKRNNLLKTDSGEFLGRLAPFHLIPQELLDSNVDNLSCSMTGSDKSAESNWIFGRDLNATIREHSTSVVRHRFLTAVFNARKDPDFISYLRIHVNDIQSCVDDISDIPEFMMESQPENLVTCAIDYSGMDAREAVELLRSIKEECI